MRHKWIWALAAAACIMLAVPFTGGAAQDLDLNRDCSLTVSSGDGEMAGLLAEAGVVVDLYKVADASEEGAGGYGFISKGAFSALQIGEDIDGAGWQQLAQQAAGIALGADGGPGQVPSVQGAALDSPITSGSGGNLDAGLYLLIARGADVKDYVVAARGEDGEERIATVAYTRDKTIRFAPELVAVPSKEADENGVINTANPGEWIYDLTVYLKPETDVRYGSLEIIKDLLTYEDSYEATFVFQVEAVLDGETVYSDVVTISFTEPGRKQILIDNIPVGAVVTVTEVYSGAGYKLVSQEPPGSFTITADETASVTFTNDYENRRTGGLGITNRFSYSIEEGEWEWVQE